MRSIVNVIKQRPIEAISLIISVSAAFITFIVYLAVWQAAITAKVAADEVTLSSQTMTIQHINDTVNNISTKQQVNSQAVNDMSDKVNLIYQLLQK